MFKFSVQLFIGLVMSANAFADLNLTSFDKNRLDGWEHKIFENETDYQVVAHKNRMALKAVSNNSASGMVLKKKIDLLDTPYINWSWFIENNLPKLNEQSKDGDDYVARIYVVLDGGFLPWRTKSLNYVWSSSQAQGQVWDNAFAGSNVQMISVRGKDANVGQWYDEKRNVYNDLIRFLGDKGSDKANQNSYRYIDIIAIMTDTDNSGSKAVTYYGDIVFSAD